MSTDTSKPDPRGPMTLPPLHARLRHSVGWSMFGTFVSRALTLASSILIARVIGKVEFGELALIQSSILMFSIFAGFGLGFAATRGIAEFKGKDPARTCRIQQLVSTISMITCGVSAGLLFILAPWLAETVFAAPHLADMLKVAALILLFETLNVAQNGILAGFEAFDLVARTNTISALMQVILQVVGVLTAGIWGALWALVCARIFTWILNKRYITNKMQQFLIPDRAIHPFTEWPLLIRFSLPAFVSGLLGTPFMWIVNAILVNQPGGFAEMGIFRAAQYFFLVFVIAGQTIAIPLLPIIVSLKGIDRNQAEKASIMISWVIGLLPVFPLILFPELIMNLYGEDYYGITFIATFLIVMLYTCIYSFNISLGIITLANDLNWKNATSHVLFGITLLISFTMLRNYGSVGVAISYLLGYSVSTIFLMFIIIAEKIQSASVIFSIHSLILWLIIPISLFFGCLEYIAAKIVVLIICLIISVITILSFYRRPTI